MYFSHLEFLLVKCERAWSYANELKLEASSSSRAQCHYNRRLVKASKHAQQLAAVCAARSDGRTKLEAEVSHCVSATSLPDKHSCIPLQAYSCWMSALLLIEHKTWAEALEKLIRAK